MSAETEIAKLVAEYAALKQRYEDRADEIDAAVAAALRTIPNTHRTYYVSGSSGDDAAIGSASDPLRTIGQAIRRVPAGGQLDLYLGNQRYVIADRITIPSLTINVRRTDNTGGGPVIEQADIDDGDQVTGGFRGNVTWSSFGIRYQTARFTTDNPSGTIHPRVHDALFSARDGINANLFIEAGRIWLGHAHFASIGLGPGRLDYGQRDTSLTRLELLNGAAPGVLYKAHGGVVGALASSDSTLPTGETWADLVSLNGAAVTTNVGI